MIKTHHLLATLATAVALSTVAQPSHAQEAPPIHNVVLVHGLFADGSSWEKVIPLLQKAGLHVTSVQNPLTSFDDDVQATDRAIALQDGPVLLVAHSYGGMVITQAGNDPKVKGLVYVAARAPDAGENFAALAGKFPTPPASAGIVWAQDGFGQLSEPAFLRDFAGDLPEAEARGYYAVQGRVAKSTPTASPTQAAWRTKPSWYAVSTQDRTINPDLERFMAQRMKATTIEIDASHVSMLSHPKQVAELILSAAGASK
ncbi:alpha/beta hydrolase [soil metagenome]